MTPCHALGDAPVTPDERDRLAMRYKLGPGGVGAAITTARRLGASDAPRLPDVVAGIRNNIAERMGGLAQRVEVKQAWDELVLGADTLDQVRALAARVQHGHTVLEKWRLGQKLHRGSGVAALFSGPPGTGKTMVAGLFARQLELELYQVDLSKVVPRPRACRWPSSTCCARPASSTCRWAASSAARAADAARRADPARRSGARRRGRPHRRRNTASPADRALVRGLLYRPA